MPALGIGVSDKDIIKVFILKIYFILFGVLNMQQTKTISTIIDECYIWISPAKFGSNPTSSLGDVI